MSVLTPLARHIAVNVFIELAPMRVEAMRATDRRASTRCWRLCGANLRGSVTNNARGGHVPRDAQTPRWGHWMFDARTLKPFLRTTPATVECPVLNCAHIVTRQRKSFRRNLTFRCPDHDIYISPSTFEYAALAENLLAMDAEDLALFAAQAVQRASRQRRERKHHYDIRNSFVGFVSK